jgi:hypothetical protein
MCNCMINKIRRWKTILCITCNLIYLDMYYLKMVWLKPKHVVFYPYDNNKIHTYPNVFIVTVLLKRLLRRCKDESKVLWARPCLPVCFTFSHYLRCREVLGFPQGPKRIYRVAIKVVGVNILTAPCVGHSVGATLVGVVPVFSWPGSSNPRW